MKELFYPIIRLLRPKVKRSFNDLERHSTELEYLLVGINYQTTFEAISLGKANNLKAAEALFKERFPKGQNFEKTIEEIPETTFWKWLNTGISYRGNKNSGIQTNEKYERAINKAAEGYQSAISRLINSHSKYYDYNSDVGIPDYPVFWSFRLLFNREDQWYFIYGSASD